MKVIALLAAAVLFLSSVAHAGPVPNDDDLTEFEAERGEPSQFYLDEIKKLQVKAGRKNAPETAEVGEYPMRYADTQSNSVIRSGDTIAIQLNYVRSDWLSCVNSPCHKSGCPGFTIEGADWDNCWGEVFQIYRLFGPGDVTVGDVIGIHYTREPGNWFGCAGALCGKANCPGQPSLQYGFQDSNKVFFCWGEVFQIYARGKNVGDKIYANDDVTIFYIYGQDWIGFAASNPYHITCPGNAPPADFVYDVCWGEVYEIWKR